MRTLLIAIPILCAAASSLRGQLTPAEAENPNQKFSEIAPLPPPPAKGNFNVRFDGAKGIPVSELRQAGAEIISSIQSRGLTPPRADDAAFYTEVFYRRQGYTSALVDWQIADGGNTLVLTIDEGPLTTLGGTTFQGNDHYADSVLRDFLIGATRERFSRLKTTLPFVEQDINTGMGRLLSFYQSEGFLDAQVWPWPVEYSADLSQAKLGVTIDEGLQYWFGQLNFTGASPELEAKLRESIIKTTQLPYTALRLENLGSQLQQQLKSLGYFNATVQVIPVAMNTDQGIVDADILVQAGDKFTFDGITSTGTEKLHPDFLQERFAFLSGQSYDPALLDEVNREVVGTGLFSEFRIHETPLPNHQVRLDLTVKENPAKEFGLYGGFGTYEGGFVGTSFQDRNWLGRGRPLIASLEASQRGLTGELEYVDPWFLERGNELRIKLFSSTIDNEGYSDLKLGLRLDVSRKFNKQFRVGAFALLQTSSTTAQEIDPALLGPLDYQTFSAGVSMTLDMRNNPLAPSRGWVFDSALSQTQFSTGAAGLRSSLRLSYYLPVGTWLFAVGARSSSFLTSEDLTAIPIDERYFNGGGTTVRSFAERELGPLYNDTYPLGGLSRTILNAEVVIPIISDLKAAIFVDAGNLLATDDLLSTDNFRYAIGAGIRYNLPVGPLRLDYGYNPNPQLGEKSGAFHFSFGFAF